MWRHIVDVMPADASRSISSFDQSRSRLTFGTSGNDSTITNHSLGVVISGVVFVTLVYFSFGRG